MAKTVFAGRSTVVISSQSESRQILALSFEDLLTCDDCCLPLMETVLRLLIYFMYIQTTLPLSNTHVQLCVSPKISTNK